MDARRLWLMWWSGVFTVVAFVHLVRSLANIPVTIGTVAIPAWISWVIFPMAGLIAGWLMCLALKQKEQMPSRPPTLAAGGLHPKSSGKEALQHAGQTYCGIQAGDHAVGEDDEPE